MNITEWSASVFTLPTPTNDYEMFVWMFYAVLAMLIISAIISMIDRILSQIVSLKK